MICSNPSPNINLLDMYSLQLRHPEIIESNSNRILCMKQFMFLRAFSIFLYLEWISTKIMALILFCIHFLTVQQCTTMNQCWQTSMSAMEVGYVYIGHQGGMSEICRPYIPTFIAFGFLLRRAWIHMTYTRKNTTHHAPIATEYTVYSTSLLSCFFF